MKWLAALSLVWRFAVAVLMSGLQTIGAILKTGRPGGPPPPAALLRVGFTPMSARGAALLGCLVTLTPGTTTLDIDMERHELLLHVLDATDTQALVEGIRRDFEPGLLAWFGTGARR